VLAQQTLFAQPYRILSVVARLHRSIGFLSRRGASMVLLYFGHRLTPGRGIIISQHGPFQGVSASFFSRDLSSATRFSSFFHGGLHLFSLHIFSIFSFFLSAFSGGGLYQQWALLSAPPASALSSLFFSLWAYRIASYRYRHTIDHWADGPRGPAPQRAPDALRLTPPSSQTFSARYNISPGGVAPPIAAISPLARAAVTSPLSGGRAHWAARHLFL